MKPTKQEQKRKQGRPSAFTPEIGLEICKRIASGESLNKICKDKHLPSRDTVVNWALGYTDRDDDGKVKNPDIRCFSDNYARARVVQATLLADEIFEITDDNSRDFIEDEKGRMVPNWDNVARARLKVDTRKWYLSKVLPKIFGDKLDLTSGGEKLRPASFTFIGHGVAPITSEAAIVEGN